MMVSHEVDDVEHWLGSPNKVPSTGMALAVAEGILGAPHDPVPGVGEGFLEWVETAKDVGGTISAAFPERWLAALHQRERIERAAHGLHDLRHKLVYAKPTLPKLGFRQLDHRVLHGRNPLTGKDVEALMEAGVTRVIDLRENHEWSRPRCLPGPTRRPAPRVRRSSPAGSTSV